MALAIAPPEARAETTRRAVLIGIDEYRAAEIEDLGGCANDVDLMKSVLVGKFDFAPEDVLVLKNEQATRKGIIDGIRSHLGQSRHGDIALVHYSGHGSQMDDRSGDEADRKDETIVPHDSRQGGIFDISDDEINGLMKQISDKTPNVVFILDSCHSGTASRAVAAGNVARQAPADDRVPPEPEPWALGARGLEEGADGIRLPGANYVLISGCRANELSNEAAFNGARHGAMTFFLSNALRAAGEQTTYRDVMEQVKADVNARFSLQHPQLEGTGADTKIFGAERILPQPYVLVEPRGSGATVRAGEFFGVQVDTELPVYPKGTKVFDGAVAPIATVRVTDVQDFESSAAVVDGEVRPHSRTVLGKVAPPAYRAGLYFHGLDASPLLQSLAEALADEKTIQIVADRQQAEMRASVEGAGDDVRVVLRGRELQLLSEASAASRGHQETDCEGRLQDAQLTFPLGTPAATVVKEKAIAQIQHWAHWFGLLAIENTGGGDLPMDFRIERADAEPGDAAPEAIAPGDQVRVTVRNGSKDQKVYLTLLDFRRTGQVCVLHPRATPAPLEPGELWQAEFPAGIPEGLEEDVDILKAIFTTEEIPASVFALGAAPRALFSSILTSGWSTQKRVLRVARPGVENRGFVAHYATAEAAERDPQALSRARDASRFEGTIADDPTMVEWSTAATRGSDPSVDSVGAAFQQAYEFRKQACAENPDACPLRVEPMLELELERSQSAPLSEDESIRGLGSGDPLPVAEGDAAWSHKYTRVPEAWAHLAALGRPSAAVARGVTIAHPDTGYLQHPEIWEPASDRPILFDKGWDYLEDDDEPVDQTEKDRPLDNPVHGTGSSSAIVSRAGCQIEGFEKCPTGVAQGAHLVPLRINSSVINFSGKRLAKALLDASSSNRERIKVDTDLAVIAMGGPPSWTLWKAVNKAEDRGFIVLAAAGNYVRTVVWPARYDSVLSVAAVNANCEPWAHSSRGKAVDIAAPGESVWRATINEQNAEVTGMGTGTTYGTATTGGIAALWVAKHKGTPEYEALKARGLLTRTLRWLMQETSWRPGTDRVPAEAQCKAEVGWNADRYGAGVLDAAELLKRELPTPDEIERETGGDGTRSGDAPAAQGRGGAPIEDLPLWRSLYPRGTSLEVSESDYLSLFADAGDDPLGLAQLAIYEAEILHHYTMNEPLAEALDAITLQGRRGRAAVSIARERLRAQDLSTDLRRALQ